MSALRSTNIIYHRRVLAGLSLLHYSFVQLNMHSNDTTPLIIINFRKKFGCPHLRKKKTECIDQKLLWYRDGGTRNEHKLLGRRVGRFFSGRARWYFRHAGAHFTRGGRVLSGDTRSATECLHVTGTQE